MTARRGLVLAVLALCALLVSPLPLHGFGLAAALALAALDVALLAATGALAFSRRRSLDERQAALRDLAYRRGFRLLGLGIVLAAIATALGVWIVGAQTGPSGGLSQVDSGLSGRLLVTVAELVVALPTLVVAWSRHGGAGRPAAAMAPALVAVALAAGWPLAVGRTPVQAAAVSRSFSVDYSETDATCRHFVAGRVVGGGLGATVGMRVEVCWNGHEAFVIGDPSVPLPPDVMADPRDPFLTACGADDLSDFATVADTTCTATTGGDGALHYSVQARVLPLPFGIGARDVVMELVVAPDGRVLRQP